MDELDLIREIMRTLASCTTPIEAKRVLTYLTDWNTARPLPPASNT